MEQTVFREASTVCPQHSASYGAPGRTPSPLGGTHSMWSHQSAAYGWSSGVAPERRHRSRTLSPPGRAHERQAPPASGRRQPSHERRAAKGGSKCPANRNPHPAPRRTPAAPVPARWGTRQAAPPASGRRPPACGLQKREGGDTLPTAPTPSAQDDPLRHPVPTRWGTRQAGPPASRQWPRGCRRGSEQMRCRPHPHPAGCPTPPIQWASAASALTREHRTRTRRSRRGYQR